MRSVNGQISICFSQVKRVHSTPNPTLIPTPILLGVFGREACILVVEKLEIITSGHGWRRVSVEDCCR